jgi:hypothetical protein
LGLGFAAARLPSSWNKDDHPDRLGIVLHTVLERQCLDTDDDGFTPISERRLAEVVGRDFASSALHLLCDPKIGVLESDGRYSPGIKCRGYRYRDVMALDPSRRWMQTTLRR